MDNSVSEICFTVILAVVIIFGSVLINSCHKRDVQHYCFKETQNEECFKL